MVSAGTKIVLLSGAIVLGGAVLSSHLRRSAEEAQFQNLVNRCAAEDLLELRGENTFLKQGWSAGWDRFGRDRKELAQLRAEAARLRAQLNPPEPLPAEFHRGELLAAEAETPEETEADAVSQQIDRDCLTRLSSLQRWMQGFLDYAGQNEGRLPGNFAEAEEFVSAAPAAEGEPTPDQLQIVYNGELSDVRDPSATVVIQEKTVHATPDGRWSKAYVFADGHAQVHIGSDTDFTRWERGLENRATAVE